MWDEVHVTWKEQERDTFRPKYSGFYLYIQQQDFSFHKELLIIVCKMF